LESYQVTATSSRVDYGIQAAMKVKEILHLILQGATKNAALAPQVRITANKRNHATIEK
jgi:hypothetical protein